SAPVDSGHRALLEQRGAVLHVAEPGTVLADWLRRGRSTAVIVRPDRTVLRAGRRPDELCDAVPNFSMAQGRR
ncbi:MAG: hypothetical protein ACXVGO_14340, partial [Mycobacterium sp.]